MRIFPDFSLGNNVIKHFIVNFLFKVLNDTDKKISILDSKSNKKEDVMNKSFY